MKYEALVTFDSLEDVGKVRFVHCLRCGKKLKTCESQKLGFGKICYKKHLSKSQQQLF